MRVQANMKPLNGDGVPVDISEQSASFSQDKGNRSFNMNRDSAKKLKILGSTQIVLGLISIAAHAVSIVIHTAANLPGLHFVGYGFWCGAIFGLTGMFGIISGLQRSRCITSLFNLLSIVSACFTSPLITLALISAAKCAINERYNYKTDETSYGFGEHRNAQIAAISMEALMALVAVVEAIVAIRSSLAVSKVGYCCCGCEDSSNCRPHSVSCQTPGMICRMGPCFCQWVGFSFSSSQPIQNQKSTFTGITDEFEQQRTIAINNNNLFYPATLDQEQAMAPEFVTQMNFDENYSDSSKLIEA